MSETDGTEHAFFNLVVAAGPFPGKTSFYDWYVSYRDGVYQKKAGYRTVQQRCECLAQMGRDVTEGRMRVDTIKPEEWMTMLPVCPGPATFENNHTYRWQIREHNTGPSNWFSTFVIANEDSGLYRLECSGIELYGRVRKTADPTQITECPPPQFTEGHDRGLGAVGILHWIQQQKGEGVQKCTVTATPDAEAVDAFPTENFLKYGVENTQSMHIDGPKAAITVKTGEYEVQPTYYALLVCDLQYSPRNWSLEAIPPPPPQQVGAPPQLPPPPPPPPETLKTHTNDKSIPSHPVQISPPPPENVHTYRWAIDDDTQWFTRFRILQTGKNAHSNTILKCSGMELYGSVRSTASPQTTVEHPPPQLKDGHDQGLGTRGILHWITDQGGSSCTVTPTDDTGFSSCNFLKYGAEEIESDMFILGDEASITVTIPNYEVRPTYYALSVIDLEHSPRNWKLEARGSGSGGWTTLKEHTDDESIPSTELSYTRDTSERGAPGILHWIGQLDGTTTWKNPYTCKLVDVWFENSEMKKVTVDDCEKSNCVTYGEVSGDSSKINDISFFIIHLKCHRIQPTHVAMRGKWSSRAVTLYAWDGRRWIKLDEDRDTPDSDGTHMYRWEVDDTQQYFQHFYIEGHSTLDCGSIEFYGKVQPINENRVNFYQQIGELVMTLAAPYLHIGYRFDGTLLRCALERYKQLPPDPDKGPTAAHLGVLHEYVEREIQTRRGVAEHNFIPTE